jgi:molybdopterin/thiamine biosynthesis adenylyltransferase
MNRNPLSANSSNWSDEELSRYARPLRLPEVGLAGQTILKQASVLVVGAGGLGSSAILHLAASGIGRIGIVDPDKVELDNLHRQIIHGMPSLGTAKVDSARRRIGEINPRTIVEAHPELFSESNAEDLARSFSIIVDGSDNLRTRRLINRTCLLQKKPMVYGSAQGFEGQLSVFDADHGPCYRCVFPDLPDSGAIESPAESGVIGPLPGIVGTLQALEAIKILLRIGEPYIGRLLLFHGLTGKSEEIKVLKNSHCPECNTTK